MDKSQITYYLTLNINTLNENDGLGLVSSFKKISKIGKYQILEHNFNAKNKHSSWGIYLVTDKNQNEIKHFFLQNNIKVNVIKLADSDILTETWFSEINSANKKHKILDVQYKIIKQNKKKLIENSKYVNIGHWGFNILERKLSCSAEVFNIFELDSQKTVPTIKLFFKNVFLDDKRKVKKTYINSLKKKETFEIEHRLLLKSGKIKYVTEKCTTEYDNNGKPVYSLGTISDITNQKEIEFKIEKQDKKYDLLFNKYKNAYEQLQTEKEKAEESDRLKTVFLANMSHEIRTPMNAILGFAGILKNKNKTAEQKDYFTDVIIKNGNHLLSLINDILDISKIDAVKQIAIENVIKLNSFLHYQSVNFKNLLNENVNLIINTNLEDVEIITDETRLQQVFTNLIGNAIKFTKKGTIEISYIIREDNMIEFSIKDTGIGISKKAQQYIFERFRQVDETVTRKYGGTGLGLAISKGIINLLGGNVWINSEPSVGTTFYFTIKYKKQEIMNQTSINTTSLKTKNIFKGKKILIVEDDHFSFEVLEIFLEETNAKIIHAIDGVEAIQFCEDISDIDLILMDINLPKLDGLSATKEILKIHPSMPIIAQTGNAMPEDKQKSKDAGCVYHISKPVKENELLIKIAQYIN